MDIERKYSKPPINEVVCEIALGKEVDWDPATPGILYEQIKDLFPKRKGSKHQEVSFKSEKKGLSQEIRVTDRAIFLSEDEKCFVQVGPRVIAINKLYPYSSWEELKPLIERVIKGLSEVINRLNIHNINLLYDNIIEIPGPEVELDYYFNFRPYFGQGLPQTMRSFLVGCLFPGKNESDNARVELTSLRKEQNETKAFRLTISYFLSKSGDFALADILEWIDDAHTQIQELFEGCITDNLREILEEEG